MEVCSSFSNNLAIWFILLCRSQLQFLVWLSLQFWSNDRMVGTFPVASSALTHSTKLWGFISLLLISLLVLKIFILTFSFKLKDAPYFCHVLLFPVMFRVYAHRHISVGHLCLDSHSETLKCHLHCQEAHNMLYNYYAAGSFLPLGCFSSGCTAQVFGYSCLIFFFFWSLVFLLKFWVWDVEN